jgi:hypothetical protein
LVGLITLFIFPVCVNAQVATGCGDWTATEEDAPKLLPIENEYTLTPTFKWIAASGGTNYTVTLDDESTFADPTLQTSGDLTAEAANCAEDPEYDNEIVCSWTPTSDLPPTGGVYWKVSGTGECDDGTTFAFPEAAITSDPVTPKVATFSVEVATTGFIRPDDEVTVPVSMANPGFDATAVSFSVLYDSGKFDPPTGTVDDDLILDPDIGTDNVQLTNPTPGTVTVTITGSDTNPIPADIGRLLDLIFTVKENATPGDAEFTVTDMDVTVKSGDTEIDVPEATTGTAPVTVSPEAGDADGDGARTLKDVILFLDVAAGATEADLGPGVTVYSGADVDGIPGVGVPEAIFTMGVLLTN